MISLKGLTEDKNHIGELRCQLEHHTHKNPWTAFQNVITASSIARGREHTTTKSRNMTAILQLVGRLSTGGLLTWS